ncbi:hypothetical protein AgCh_005395 [Apium graveolens]
MMICSLRVVCRILRSQRLDGFPVDSSNPNSSINEISQEKHFPYCQDDKSSDHDRKPSHTKRPPLRSTYRTFLNARSEQKDVQNFLSNMDLSSSHKPELVASEENLKKSLKSVNSQAVNFPSKGRVGKAARSICSSAEVYSQIERTFLHEVGNAEEIAKLIEPGNMEMPDAMEIIFKTALDLGRHGAASTYNFLF